MPENPVIIMAILGAILLMISIIGRIEAEKIKIGISRMRSRVIAGTFGTICLGGAIFLQYVPGHQSLRDDNIRGSLRDSAFVSGQWRCKTESEFIIDWLMEATANQNTVTFAGSKTMVNGKPADEVERLTFLRLTGDTTGNVLRGRYTETGRTSTMSGMFELTFDQDFRSFSGAIYRPSGKIGSKFSGFRIK